jgi:hypothetical protein
VIASLLYSTMRLFHQSCFTIVKCDRFPRRVYERNVCRKIFRQIKFDSVWELQLNGELYRPEQSELLPYNNVMGLYFYKV